MLIDFTDLPHKKKGYSGANGNKICVVYNNEQYMLKFPPPATKTTDMSYANSCFSEYIGCHIYEQIGIPVQKTLLGTYDVGNKQRIVVACKDFTDLENGIVLQDFASLKNQVVQSSRNGYGTELEDILTSIQTQKAIDSQVLLERFWDMFIVDAYIGNWDRHNGNWGILYNAKTDEVKLAPVYDCGSSLFPQASIEKINEIIDDKGQFYHRVFNIPFSSVQQNGKRIGYHGFITSLENADCNAALKRIVPKIDQSKVDKIIDNTPAIEPERKSFLKLILAERKSKILDFSLNNLENTSKVTKTTVPKPLSF